MGVRFTAPVTGEDALAEARRLGRGLRRWLGLTTCQRSTRLGKTGQRPANAGGNSASRGRLGNVQPDELDELGGLATFSRSRQLYYAADALAWLPDEAAAAEDYSTQAVQAYADPAHPTGPSVTKPDLTQT
jgi:hypothetical protein